MSDRPPKDHKVHRPYGRWIPSNETDVTRTWEIARQKIEHEKLERERIVSQLPKRKECK